MRFKFKVISRTESVELIQHFETYEGAYETFLEEVVTHPHAEVVWCETTAEGSDKQMGRRGPLEI